MLTLFLGPGATMSRRGCRVPSIACILSSLEGEPGGDECRWTQRKAAVGAKGLLKEEPSRKCKL